MKKDDRQLFKDWVMENTNLFQLLRIMYWERFKTGKFRLLQDYYKDGMIFREAYDKIKKNKTWFLY